MGSEIVGEASELFAIRSFFWSPATGMVDLRSHLLANGAECLAGWSLFVQDVSDDGNAFVGFILIVGICWFVGWLFSSKESTYDVDIKRHTFGTVKKRR